MVSVKPGGRDLGLYLCSSPGSRESFGSNNDDTAGGDGWGDLADGALEWKADGTSELGGAKQGRDGVGVELEVHLTSPRPERDAMLPRKPLPHPEEDKKRSAPIPGLFLVATADR
jgi:hypothetical protein